MRNSRGHPLLEVPLRTQLAVVLPIAAVLRIAVAVLDHGIFWPDEIYQVTEPAHRLAFGYGFRAWEFRDGIRSWLLPGLLAGVLRVADLAGVHSGLGLMTVVRVLFALAGVAAVGATMALAWRIGGSVASLIAGSLSLAFPMVLVLGGHTFAESVSAPLLVGAAALVATREVRTRHAAIAGVLAAFAVVMRPQNAIVLLGLAAVLAAWRVWRPLRAYVLAAAAVALVPLVLDWATWGAPFASMTRYVEFNLAHASEFGTSSWHYYVDTLLSANGVLILLVVVGIFAAARRAPGLIAIIVVYLVAHSVVGHKELRFLLPIVPIALGVAAVGLAVVVEATASRLSAREGRRRRALTTVVVALLVAMPVVGVVEAAGATVGAYGRPHLNANRSVWHLREGWNVLASRAGTDGVLCGLASVPTGPVVTGGYSYLHRNVPVFAVTLDDLRATRELPRGANEAILGARAPVPRGYHVVSTSGQFRLARRAGRCGPPPATASSELGGPPHTRS